MHYEDLEIHDTLINIRTTNGKILPISFVATSSPDPDPDPEADASSSSSFSLTFSTSIAFNGLTGRCGMLFFFTIADDNVSLGFKTFLITGMNDFFVLFTPFDGVSDTCPSPLTIFCAEASCLTTAASLPLANESPDPEPDSEPDPSSGKNIVLTFTCFVLDFFKARPTT